MRKGSYRKVLPAALLASALLAGCGSAGSFANRPRPAIPVNLTVYVDNHGVSVSPAHVGAGPVQFLITNEATRNETIAVRGSGGQSVASSGPINPGATTQVTVDFNRGTYQLAPADISTGEGSSVHAAALHIGAPRPSAKNALLQP